MEEKGLKIERQWNDKSGPYLEPLGWQVTGLSLDGVPYETRMHEWTVEYVSKTSNKFQMVFNDFKNEFQTEAIGSILNQPPRVERVLEFCQ